MDLLSFRPMIKTNMRGGHRPFNLDKALGHAGANIEVIEDFLPRRNRLGDVKILSKSQQAHRRTIKDFAERPAKDRYFLLHGIQSDGFIDHLREFDVPIALDFRDDPVRQFDSTLAYDTTYRQEMPGDKRIQAQGFIDNSLARSEVILFPSSTLMGLYSPEAQKKGIVCPNASDPEHFNSSPLPDVRKIGLLTGMQPIAGIETLLDSCLLIKKDFDDLVVEIGTSDGPLPGYEDHIRSKYSKYDWITFRKDIFYENAPDFFRNMYLGVNLMPRTEYFDACTPLKLFDTMASGRPIVITDLVESSRIVRDENCGLVADHSVESVAENIARLLSDRDLAQRMGSNGRKAIEERHAWSHRARTILDALSG